MKRATLTIVLVSLALSLVVAQSPGPDDQALKGIVVQLTSAQTAFDVAALERLLAPDYVEISPLGEVDSREKVIGFYQPSQRPAKVSTGVDVSDYSIRSDGHVAIVIAKLTFTVTADGQAQPPRSMRAMFVMRKDGPGWKFASAQYTGIRPPQPPAR